MKFVTYFFQSSFSSLALEKDFYDITLCSAFPLLIPDVFLQQGIQSTSITWASSGASEKL